MDCIRTVKTAATVHSWQPRWKTTMLNATICHIYYSYSVHAMSLQLRFQLLLNKTKASLERDSTFNTNFDGDTLMSGMSRDSVTQTQGQPDQSTCCQHSAVCVVCHSFELVQRRRSFNSHANDLHRFRAAVLSMLSMLRSPSESCASVCVK